ncbi:hypothetical protein THAOC_01244 [Thalassiosira oceanica]|uniref:RNA polymerase sigma-70 region 4 domain-containing protein n=1 Tax=Thalassiosira oceanica TaxID=159749 RepID=K0TN95_THAOC|nr:hypothetical protein THAOC_01244 [Thalassiosira oceanica]|eukprot:EJK76961.1 hypothetical protein THAOC_01244 [Thalassiosira oceanica]
MDSADPRPEDQVETSFLRQCLENAMAAELTPYERDVLRLRLGLDSGSSMSVREISDLSGGAVSLGEVRAVERRALARLRSPGSVHAHNLLAYLDGGGGGSASKAAGAGRRALESHEASVATEVIF